MTLIRVAPHALTKTVLGKAKADDWTSPDEPRASSLCEMAQINQTEMFQGREEDRRRKAAPVRM